MKRRIFTAVLAAIWLTVGLFGALAEGASSGASARTEEEGLLPSDTEGLDAVMGEPNGTAPSDENGGEDGGAGDALQTAEETPPVQTAAEDDGTPAEPETDAEEELPPAEPAEKTEMSENAPEAIEEDETLTDPAPLPEEETTASVSEKMPTEPAALTLTGERIDADGSFISVEKVFEGIEAAQIPKSFAVTVSNGAKTCRLTSNGVEGASGTMTRSADGLTWRWKILGADIGQWRVSESGAAVDGYELTTSGDLDSVTVEPAEMANLTLDIYTTCSHLDWPVDGVRFFAATLTSRNGCVVITERPLSAGERAQINAAIKAKEKGTWKEPVYWYSFQDKDIAAGETVEITGGVLLTYSARDGMIYLNRTADWQHVISGSYDMRAPSVPEISIKNSYRRGTASVTLEKRVTGSLADRTKAFEFEISATVRQGGEDIPLIQTVALKDGERIALDHLVVGSELVVTERESGYEVRVETDLDGGLTHLSYAAEVSEAGGTIVFVNAKDAVIDTGVPEDKLPPLVMLLLIGAALLARSVKRT